MRCLCSQIVRDGSVPALESLAKLVDPLPLDPKWNRARALVRENSRHTTREEDNSYWRRYIEDLAVSSELAPAERDLAQGMVWVHVARAPADKANSLRHCPCGDSHADEVRNAVTECEECLEICIRLVPDHLPAYEALANLYSAADEPEKAAGVHRRCLEHVPDNFDTLEHLVHHLPGR